MDVGTGLSIGIPGGMGFIGLFGYLITIVKTRGTTTDNVSNNKTLRSMDRSERDVCPLHETFETLMTEMRNDIKQILRKVGE